MNAMLLTQVQCTTTSTFYPGSKLLALLDDTFAEYLFLCLIDAHGKTSLCGSHQVPLDYGQTNLLQTFCEDDSYDYPMISDLPKHYFCPPSYILFGTPNSLLLQTLLSLFQDLLPTHTRFLTATPT